MSAAMAMAPSPAPHDRTVGADTVPRSAAPSSHAFTAPSSHSPIMPRSFATPHSATAQRQPRSGSNSPNGLIATGKTSPTSASRRAANQPPRIIVKKEPGSPDLPTARHRPKKLDLSRGTMTTTSPATGRPMTSKDSGLGIHDMGLACLSPGFVTQDPIMKEQLQRSLSVREQQRHIIEARLQQQSAKGEGPERPESGREIDSNQFMAKTPGMQSRRNKAPPGLSIMAPNHETFANERVIQSAPLGQTFTGINNHPHPLTRHITNQPSRLSSTSHVHHVPAHQTNNRLPPIADVFGSGLSGHPESSGHAAFSAQSAARGPPSSPDYPPRSGHAPPSSRGRDFRSAEQAQQELAGGRPELLPKLVHYGGHQPPTPPSPMPGMQSSHQPSHGSHPQHSQTLPPKFDRYDSTRSASAHTKRRRDEYEAGASPPLGPGRAATRPGPFGEGRDSPETTRAKREEFLQLCERAWDLFHS